MTVLDRRPSRSSGLGAPVLGALGLAGLTTKAHSWSRASCHEDAGQAERDLVEFVARVAKPAKQFLGS
jgi:hypothetical protein